MFFHGAKIGQAEERARDVVVEVRMDDDDGGELDSSNGETENDSVWKRGPDLALDGTNDKMKVLFRLCSAFTRIFLN